MDQVILMFNLTIGSCFTLCWINILKIPIKENFKNNTIRLYILFVYTKIYINTLP